MVDIADLELHFDVGAESALTALSFFEAGSNPSQTVATLNEVGMETGALKKELKEVKGKAESLREKQIEAEFVKQFLDDFSKMLSEATEQMISHPLFAQQKRNEEQRKDEQDGGNGKKKSAAAANNNKNKKNAQTSVQTLPQNAKIGYLTTHEFESVPKYMKGRLNYESINSLIDEFNAALEKKYNFYLKGFQAMASAAEKKKFKEMKSLETRETKGRYFLVADDFKAVQSLKSESNRRILFPILRHCHRIKEIRGPASVVRFTTLQQQ